jgi:hypothetical protein
MNDEPIITQADDETYEQRLERLVNTPVEPVKECIGKNGQKLGAFCTVYTGEYDCKLCLNRFYVYRGSKEFCEKCYPVVIGKRIAKHFYEDHVKPQEDRLLAAIQSAAKRIDDEELKKQIQAEQQFRYGSVTVEGEPRFKIVGVK